MRAEDDIPKIPALATDIVVAYLGHHTIATGDIGQLITVVARELGTVGRVLEPEPPAKPEPAVPVNRSVQRDHLVCLVCGKPFKSLRRHLQSAHQLTDSQYRELFGLARTYPMVAKASTEQRAAIARRTQLGQRRDPAAAPASVPEAEPALAAAPEAAAEPASTAAHAVAAMPEIAAEPAVAAETPSVVHADAAQEVPPAPPPAARPVRGRRAAAKKPQQTSSMDLASLPQPDPEPDPAPDRAPAPAPETKPRRPARRKRSTEPG